MNTRFEYQYRDGQNYKQYGEVVVAGAFTLEQLRPHLYERAFFVPSEVGLDDRQEEPYRACDHVWHELVSAEPTADAPTVDVRAEEMVARFRAAGEVRWERAGVIARMGIWSRNLGSRSDDFQAFPSSIDSAPDTPN